MNVETNDLSETQLSESLVSDDSIRELAAASLALVGGGSGDVSFA